MTVKYRIEGVRETSQRKIKREIEGKGGEDNRKLPGQRETEKQRKKGKTGRQRVNEREELNRYRGKVNEKEKINSK